MCRETTVQLNIRCWEISAGPNGQPNTVPKAQQTMGGPILDTCWSDDGSKVKHIT